MQDNLNRMHYLKSRFCTIAEYYLAPQVIGLPVPRKIKSFVLPAYFAEILQHYSASERQLIIQYYGTIDSFNNGVDELSNPQQELVGKKYSTYTTIVVCLRNHLAAI